MEYLIKIQNDKNDKDYKLLLKYCDINNSDNDDYELETLENFVLTSNFYKLLMYLTYDPNFYTKNIEVKQFYDEYDISLNNFFLHCDIFMEILKKKNKSDIYINSLIKSTLNVLTSILTLHDNNNNDIYNLFDTYKCQLKTNLRSLIPFLCFELLNNSNEFVSDPLDYGDIHSYTSSESESESKSEPKRESESESESYNYNGDIGFNDNFDPQKLMSQLFDFLKNSGINKNYNDLEMDNNNNLEMDNNNLEMNNNNSNDLETDNSNDSETDNNNGMDTDDYERIKRINEDIQQFGDNNDDLVYTDDEINEFMHKYFCNTKTK